MLQAAIDFKEECDALAAILQDATDADFHQVTQFKDWTIEDVIGHLHLWNIAAAETLKGRENWMVFFTFVMEQMGQGAGHPQLQRAWFEKHAGDIKGKALFEAWRDFYPELSSAYANSDPAQRVAWAGPDMSTESKIIARQMETWAHGQEVFDILGIERHDTDRIRNIAHLGVTTYGWTFRNRSEEPPKPKPFVQLTAPSGEIWEWNDPQEDNKVIGTATEFCQIVTQTRNVKDTHIVTTGETAEKWMSIAQCFAGAAEVPPPQGKRHRVSV
ncbi:MAG: TIGR03084 family metal-binding protein [Aquisalinus sp.]|nr:TIGR03084 family metal-binding protein [Aquisalinus sp.]